MFDASPPAFYGTASPRRKRRFVLIYRSFPAETAAAASPNGLPSESLQIAHASPGWTTLPPSASTSSSAFGRSSTLKYGIENVSPGPLPLLCTPIAGVFAFECHPAPSPSLRGWRG